MKYIAAITILASLAIATPIQLGSKRDSITYVESQSRPGGGGVYDPLKGSQPPAGSQPAWLEFRRGTKNGGGKFYRAWDSHHKLEPSPHAQQGSIRTLDGQLTRQTHAVVRRSTTKTAPSTFANPAKSTVSSATQSPRRRVCWSWTACRAASALSSPRPRTMRLAVERSFRQPRCTIISVSSPQRSGWVRCGTLGPWHR